MVGLTGYKLYIANFFDKKGEYVGSKKVAASFTAPKKQHFPYQGGIYNIKNEVSRYRATPFPYLFDYYYYNYEIGNPDPLIIKTNITPLFNASYYDSILRSDILLKLNNTRKGGLLSFLTSKNMILILGIIAVAIYFLTGGSLTDPATTTAVVNETINQTLNNGTFILP